MRSLLEKATSFFLPPTFQLSIRHLFHLYFFFSKLLIKKAAYEDTISDMVCGWIY